MYIVGVQALRRDLSRDLLDPGDVAIYVFLSFASVPIFYFEAVPDSPFSGIASTAVLGISQLVVSAVGVWRCYLVNGGRAGHRFAERFLALAWVVSIRLLLVVAPLFIVLTLALDVELDALWVEFSMLGFSTVYFWRIWVHLHWVANHTENAA